MAPEKTSSMLAEHDPGIGVDQRDALFRQIDELFQPGSPSGPVVMLLEIHHLQQLDGAQALQTGDRVISRLARRLQRVIPLQAIVGRLGAAGFAIALPGDEGLDLVVEQILEISGRPFALGGRIIFISVSMGIAIGPEHGRDAVNLVQAADVALQALGENAAERYLIFSEEMISKANSSPHLADDLQQSVVTEKPALLAAVAAKQFEVFYQPLISANTRRPVAVEALLRWCHPERGYLEPKYFIPLAEETGLINLLGTWVLQSACRDIQSIRQHTAFNKLKLSVNVSARQLDDASSFTRLIGKTLTDSGFPAEDLVLEITEHTALQCDPYEIARVLKKKCSLALDDFGTGYAAMNVFRNLPFRQAKLDRGLVCQLFREDNDTQEVDEQMIRAFQQMCRVLEISTTIEGVETREQADYLTELGCDLLQGFYFSEAVPLDQLSEYLGQFEGAVDG